MMSNNKILTVSYGTFSCTLEGFDDSFGTMKAIAEYFRDLASDDRYFGAEPPQPDAEMLTRIAEREISRRVEAREHEGRIVLSAGQERTTQVATAAAALASAGASNMDEAVDMDEAAAKDTVAESHEAETPDVDAQAVVDIEPVQDNAAADASELEATDEAGDDAQDVIAVAEVEAEDAAAPELEQDEETATETTAEMDVQAVEAADVDASDVPATPIVIEDAEAQNVDVEDVDTESESVDVEDVDADAESVEAEELDAEDIIAPAPAAPDSIAAKLQRIRAVVSQSQQEDEEDELFEDEHAEDIDAADTVDTAPAEAVSQDDAVSQDSADAVVAEAARDIQDAFRVDDAQDAAETDADEGDDDDIAAILARFDQAEKDDAITAAPETANEAEDDLGLDTLAALMAADEGQSDEDDADDNIFDETANPEPVAEAPRRARIIKVKRADIDAALASGQLEEVEDDEDEDDPADATSLSEQDEAELLAELAQVEAELPEGDTDVVDEVAADAEDIIDDADEPAQDVAAKVADEKVADDDVSRLMAEADSQMEEPEGSGRRNAFAHLKAAVAAKKADADIGNDSIKDEGAFRSDLASVVKPRRPEAGNARSERPEDTRPAPLKLVAEQRVDMDTTPKGPVRPRRVAALEEVEVEANTEGTFAEYAADLGAHNLPALLEAAASYLSFVEGRDQFSRPQLMNKVRQVEKEDFSREDGLRSFGQLLRNGKIEKMKGGGFAVTNDIGYRPDTRAAG